MRANERTDERVAQYLRLDFWLFQTTVRWSTWCHLLTLSASLCASVTNYAIIFSIAPQMVRSFGYREERIGFYGGLLTGKRRERESENGKEQKEKNKADRHKSRARNSISLSLKMQKK